MFKRGSIYVILEKVVLIKIFYIFDGIRLFEIQAILQVDLFLVCKSVNLVCEIQK